MANIADNSERVAKAKAFRADNVKGYTEALNNTDDRLQAIVEHLRDAQDVQVQLGEQGGSRAAAWHPDRRGAPNKSAILPNLEAPTRLVESLSQPAPCEPPRPPSRLRRESRPMTVATWSSANPASRAWISPTIFLSRCSPSSMRAVTSAGTGFQSVVVVIFSPLSLLVTMQIYARTTLYNDNDAHKVSAYVNIAIVEIDDLIDAAEVAELLGLSTRNSVPIYRKRYPDFPEPVLVRERCIFWHRPDVIAWLRTRSA
ncbi:MAG TPA: hypothetical protein PLP26_12750 [Ilumatobacteraceae bacterium]|nr:hypothetical protein [Ilumatobacteraceae bacterium]